MSLEVHVEHALARHLPGCTSTQVTIMRRHLMGRGRPHDHEENAGQPANPRHISQPGKITDRAACSSIGGSSDIRIDFEVGVPIDSDADNDILRRVNNSDGSLGLSGGRAEHVSPRERRTEHTNIYIWANPNHQGHLMF